MLVKCRVEEESYIFVPCFDMKCSLVWPSIPCIALFGASVVLVQVCGAMQYK